MSKEKYSTKDIFAGKTFNVWEDDEFVWINLYTNSITLMLTKEDWKEFKKDLDKLSEL